MTDRVPSGDFYELREIARFTRQAELHQKGRDHLIRFLDSYSGNPAVQHVVDSLCITFGLYPYIGPHRQTLSSAEALAVEFHRLDWEAGDSDFLFHSEQSNIFHQLMDGKSIVLSAPTSFGKSVILDALIASERWNNIVAIVPTVALIDEVRRRLVRFSDRYTLVTHPTQEPSQRNIYILTQERFLELPEMPSVDFFMIDEFYKLGKRERQEEQRMSMLNIAWHRLRATGAQYFLTGPNVHSLAHTLDPELHASLFVSDFRTVAVDVEDRSNVGDSERMQDMKQLWNTLTGSTLVFVGTPKRAERVAIEISGFDEVEPAGPLAQEVAVWLGVHYHPEWRVVKALNGGVGTHTGPIPRSLQRIMIRLFAAGEITSLVCTSTLIEGVNTTAKNMIIYDKKIDQKPIDYFTFSNIRGRAGRMSRHFIGRVITYMAPPAEEATEVDIPIDSQTDDTPLACIIQLPDAALKGSSRTRLRNITTQPYLSMQTIRDNTGFDPELQVEAARRLHADESLRADFAWSGYPTKTQARAVLEFGFSQLLASRQRQGMNINRLLSTLSAVRESGGDLHDLVARQFEYRFKGEDLSDVVGSVLAFQRNWMGFTIPSLLRAAQRIYNEVAASVHETGCNYEAYVSQVENLFLPPNLLQLDEYGLPLPLALRFSEFGLSQGAEASEVLKSFIGLAQQESVRSNLSAVELWIVDDVLAGLGVFPPTTQS